VHYKCKRDGNNRRVHAKCCEFRFGGKCGGSADPAYALSFFSSWEKSLVDFVGVANVDWDLEAIFYFVIIRGGGIAVSCRRPYFVGQQAQAQSRARGQSLDTTPIFLKGSCIQPERVARACRADEKRAVEMRVFECARRQAPTSYTAGSFVLGCFCWRRLFAALFGGKNHGRDLEVHGRSHRGGLSRQAQSYKFRFRNVCANLRRCSFKRIKKKLRARLQLLVASIFGCVGQPPTQARDRTGLLPSPRSP